MDFIKQYEVSQLRWLANGWIDHTLRRCYELDIELEINWITRCFHGHVNIERIPLLTPGSVSSFYYDLPLPFLIIRTFHFEYLSELVSLCYMFDIHYSKDEGAFVMELSQISSFSFFLYRTRPFFWLMRCFYRTFATGVACKGRLLPRTPGPVPFGTCICSTCCGQSFSRTCRYFSGLCTSNIPR